MGESSKSAVKSLLEPITAISADGPETVIFTLNAGSADFPYLVSDYHLPIMPAKDGGAWTGTPELAPVRSCSRISRRAFRSS
jgi:peptide/nickel transport system substrate-binding protein